MRNFIIFLCFLSIWSCKTDKDDIDCSLYDFESRSLFIKLVDTEGNNLIENETYNADDIIILFNDYEIKNVVVKNVESINNLVVLNLIGTAGDNEFNIKLSNTEIDNLVLSLTAESAVCGYTFFKLNSVNYNGNNKIIEDFKGDYLITVIK